MAPGRQRHLARTTARGKKFDRGGTMQANKHKGFNKVAEPMTLAYLRRSSKFRLCPKVGDHLARKKKNRLLVLHPASAQRSTFNARPCASTFDHTYAVVLHSCLVSPYLGYDRLTRL